MLKNQRHSTLIELNGWALRIYTRRFLQTLFETAVASKHAPSREVNDGDIFHHDSLFARFLVANAKGNLSRKMEPIGYLRLCQAVHQSLGVTVSSSNDKDRFKPAQVAGVADCVEFLAHFLVGSLSGLPSAFQELCMLRAPLDRLSYRILRLLQVALLAALRVRHDEAHEEEIVIEIRLVSRHNISNFLAQSVNVSFVLAQELVDIFAHPALEVVEMLWDVFVVHLDAPFLPLLLAVQ